VNRYRLRATFFAFRAGLRIAVLGFAALTADLAGALSNAARAAASRAMGTRKGEQLT
jgi:hypothetical protein